MNSCNGFVLLKEEKAENFIENSQNIGRILFSIFHRKHGDGSHASKVDRLHLEPTCKVENQERIDN
jgi:hypothetical protein